VAALRPQPTPDRASAWRRHLATVIFATYVALLGALALAGRSILGVNLAAVMAASIVLIQMACGGDPVVMATDRLGQDTTRPPGSRRGIVTRVLLRPPVRVSMAAGAIAVIATHIAL
jgi:hypothetical protein